MQSPDIGGVRPEDAKKYSNSQFQKTEKNPRWRRIEDSDPVILFNA